LNTTSTAAIEMVAAAPSDSRIAAVATTASPTFGARSSSPITALQRREMRAGITSPRAEICSNALLLPATGRHAHDEWSSHVMSSVKAHRPSIDRAVKNLRIVGSAVLLLNFREVRDFHFRSTSAAM
jgi:hypothetical protein